MNIFTLTGTILVDSNDAQKSISKTSSEAEGLGGKLKSGIQTAAKWAAGVAGAATAVGTAMVAAAKKSADALGDIDDAAQRVGVDAETMQELEYVAKQSGLAMTDLEKAAKKLEGTDLNLDRAINQILALEDAEAQTQMAIELFGESVAYNLQPLLNHGAEGVKEFKEQARDLGIIMSNEAVESGAQFGDMFEAVQSSINSLKTGLMADFMPFALEILQFLIDSIPKIKETVKSVMDAIMPIVKPIMMAVMELLKSVMALINGDFDGFCEGIINTLTNLGKGLFEAGKTAFTMLWSGLKTVWEGISSWVSEKVNWLVDKLTFWDNGSSKLNATGTNVDGSHASGLSYVPYDGYIAELHRGESVNTAGQTQALLDAIQKLASGSHSNNNQPIELSINLDGQQFARAIYKPLEREGNRRGASLVIG